VAFVLRTLREEPVVAGVKLSNQSESVATLPPFSTIEGQ
jgi:hypothetical protein